METVISSIVAEASATVAARAPLDLATCSMDAPISVMEVEVSSTWVARFWAFPATLWMEAAICSMEVEVSSAVWAWRWAPPVMSLALAEISSADEVTVSDAAVICSTIWRRFRTIVRIKCSSQPISSRERLRISTVRSPLETCSVAMPSSSRGWAMRRARNSARSRPATTVTTTRVRRSTRES